MNKKSHFIKALLFLLVSILGAFVWNESLLYSQNKILFNSHWESYKKNFYGSGASAIYSLLSRNLLANNQLVLNMNLGHQILFTKEQMKPARVFIDARIAEGTYVDLLFNADGSTFEGFRISRVPGVRPFYYKAEYSGRFLEKTDFNKALFFDGDRTKIELNSFGDEIYFIVNHQLIARHKRTFQKARLGLYTGLQEVVVKDVVVEDMNGKRMSLPFARDYNKLFYFTINFLLFLALVLFLSILLKKIFSTSFPDVLVRTSLLLTGLGLLWFSFDYFYYSKVPKMWSFKGFTFEHGNHTYFDLEKIRYKTFRKWFQLIGGEVETPRLLEQSSGYYTVEGVRHCEKGLCDFYPMETILRSKKENSFRIAYIGGSFADFAGIIKIEESFFDRFGSLINSKIPDSEVANFVFSGIIFREKVKEIHALLEQYQPDLIILSVFMNNEDFRVFRQFIKTYREKNIPILYYTPLNEMVEIKSQKRLIKYTEDFRDNKKRKKFWKKLTVKQSVYFVDADKSIKEKGIAQKGLVWWDTNHMTVFAQQFVAEDLSEYVMKLINKKPL